MKHALAVLVGIAVGLPTMAALASAGGHTAGALPDRYVPWAHHLRGGYTTIRTPVRPSRVRTRHRSRVLISTSPASAGTPSPTPAGRLVRHARPAEAAEPADGLQVSIEAPHSVRPGGTYAYRIRLANRGRATPGEITVRNTLPAGVERTSTSLPGGAGGYAGGRDTTLVLPRLGPGRSATARFVVRVRPKARGELVARTRIASIGGTRVPRTGTSVSHVATRVR
ncbi:hypothetical protein [Actinoallomurus iriomotensis]|uniref:hypothetical protein n=1 Tax=Actinoallomurus iriomotensis TaxID=478107 RepID=UPI0025539D5D|nr:hypothetical protein [Actinoallomurus iriomotensis]